MVGCAFEFHPVTEFKVNDFLCLPCLSGKDGAERFPIPNLDGLLETVGDGHPRRFLGKYTRASKNT